MPDLGTAKHSTAAALAAFRALDSKEARHYALGHLIADMIESGHIGGLGEVVKQVIAQTNRYDYVDR
jgi:hypothetical protein